jgi:hypothetical protein
MLQQQWRLLEQHALQLQLLLLLHLRLHQM